MCRFIIVVAVLLLMLFTAGGADAQHNHERHHSDYQSWASGVTKNCCDNQDCGVLLDDEVRDIAAGTEVKIDDQWCPVQRKHYLVKGKSPDWNNSHACIQKKTASCDEGGCYEDTRSPCERLLCFAGKGGV